MFILREVRGVMGAADESFDVFRSFYTVDDCSQADGYSRHDSPWILAQFIDPDPRGIIPATRFNWKDPLWLLKSASALFHAALRSVVTRRKGENANDKKRDFHDESVEQRESSFRLRTDRLKRSCKVR